MLFHCPRVEANFPAVGLRLVNRAPARLVWDEHGGTFVLHLEGLEAQEAPELQGEGELRVEADLPEPAALARLIEDYAGRHTLRLEPAVGPELAVKPVLVACHIPGHNLFIFCDDPRLTLQRRTSRTLELSVTGTFKAMRVKCRETDLIIHLDMATMGRLLAGLLGWAREG